VRSAFENRGLKIGPIVSKLDRSACNLQTDFVPSLPLPPPALPDPSASGDEGGWIAADNRFRVIIGAIAIMRSQLAGTATIATS